MKRFFSLMGKAQIPSPFLFSVPQLKHGPFGKTDKKTFLKKLASFFPVIESFHLPGQVAIESFSDHKWLLRIFNHKIFR